LPALGRDLDLAVTLVDPTGEIFPTILLHQEGPMSSVLGLAETIAEHGLEPALRHPTEATAAGAAPRPD
jgi:hypothetical protein